METYSRIGVASSGAAYRRTATALDGLTAAEREAYDERLALCVVDGGLDERAAQQQALWQLGIRRTVTLLGSEWLEFELACGECGDEMELRAARGQRAVYYGCTRAPHCPGTHAASELDGAPCAEPGSDEEREARRLTRQHLDQLGGGLGPRQAWVAEVLDLPPDEAPLCFLTLEQCVLLIARAVERTRRSDGEVLVQAAPPSPCSCAG